MTYATDQLPRTEVRQKPFNWDMLGVVSVFAVVVYVMAYEYLPHIQLF